MQTTDAESKGWIRSIALLVFYVVCAFSFILFCAYLLRLEWHVATAKMAVIYIIDYTILTVGIAALLWKCSLALRNAGRTKLPQTEPPQPVSRGDKVAAVGLILVFCLPLATFAIWLASYSISSPDMAAHMDKRAIGLFLALTWLLASGITAWLVIRDTFLRRIPENKA